MTFAQHEVLCKNEMNETDFENEVMIRKKEANKICPYVDCNLDKSIELCPKHCMGRK